MDSGMAFEILFLFSFTTTLVVVLVLTTLGLTLLRQKRSRLAHVGLIHTLTPRDTLEHPPALEDTQPLPTRVRQDVLPPEWRLPIREGTPEQVVIAIQPDGGLTQRESAVHRLIDHFKRDQNAKVS